MDTSGYEMIERELRDRMAACDAEAARLRAALRALLDATAPVPLEYTAAPNAHVAQDALDCLVCGGDRMAAAVDHHEPGCAWQRARALLAKETT